MGKNDIEQMLQASRQPQLQVATPQTWEQLVAWVAAGLWPHVDAGGFDTRSDAAVYFAVQIVAKSVAALTSGKLKAAVDQEKARLEQEQADQGNPSTAQN